MLIVILLSCLFVLPFHPGHLQFQYTHPNLNEDILSDSAFDWLVSFLQQLFRSRCHHGGAFIWNNVKSPQVRRPKQSATFSRHKTSRNDAMVVSLTSPVAAVYSPMHLSGGDNRIGGYFRQKANQLTAKSIHRSNRQDYFDPTKSKTMKGQNTRHPVKVV